MRAIARITPSDERISAVLKYVELPHAAYVLGRLEGVEDPADYDIEHIVPGAPGESGSGDGVRTWRALSEDEQSSHRARAPSLGNLTLLGQPLAERVIGQSFPGKKIDAYSR